MKADEIIQAYNECVMSTYTKDPVIFVKGKGSRLWDITDKEYLDFFPGWGVNNVGHCHPNVLSAVRDQIGKLIHIPNNFYHPHQAKLAKEIVYWTGFPSKVFFCNSGAEANEGAIKLARAFGSPGGRYEIISFSDSFHGRTLATLTATGQSKYQKGFEPLPPGFKIATFNDIDSVKSLVSDKTVAVLVELIQGEGGVNVGTKEFIQALRKLCDERKMLLIFDEVQTGIGRTGKMFGFQSYGVAPDIFTLAKALGGGLPVGALVAKKDLADIFKPGMHASTFGGSPLVCKAALGVFKAVQKDKMLKNVTALSPYLFEALGALKTKYACIKDVRGMGFMVGIQLTMPGKPLMLEALKRGLIINCTHDTVIRLMPALNVTKKQIDKALAIFEEALKTVLQEQK